MKARRNRRRIHTLDSCEALEARQHLAAGLAVSPAAEVRPLDRAAPTPRAPWLFTEPAAGRQPILDAIASARHQIRLGICNFDDTIIGDALIAAAGRRVRVQVTVDRSVYLTNPAEQDLVARLTAAGVSVHLSNPIFRLSFEKDLVIDRRRVLIMTMCLEPAAFVDTTDYGLVLHARTSSATSPRSSIPTGAIRPRRA